jgi:hypothetical protein
MVEPAEYRNSLDAALHLRRSSDGLLLGERLVWDFESRSQTNTCGGIPSKVALRRLLRAPGVRGGVGDSGIDDRASP